MLAASLENGVGVCWPRAWGMKLAYDGSELGKWFRRMLAASLEIEEGCCCAPSMLVPLGAQGVEAVCGGKFVDVASG